MKKISLFLILTLALCLVGCASVRTGETEEVIVTVPPAPTSMSAPAPTPSPEPEELILSRLSLNEKAGQLIIATCHETGSAQRAAEFGVGGLCLYADAFEGKDKAQVQDMTAELQSASSLPLIIATDEEGGTVCRISRNRALRGETFLAPRELYNYGGWELVESDAAEKAELFKELGLQLNLAPVCDVPLNTWDYIYPRCLSTDAGETAEYVSRVVKVMTEQGVGCTLKHFPGYGGSMDTHDGMAYDYRSYEEFAGRDLLPFQAGIAAGAGSVMVSHNIVADIDSELPASLSPEVHRILRQELGFEGVIMTDDLYMGAIGQFSVGENMAAQAILAGNDLVLAEDFEVSVAAIVSAVENGSLRMEQINQSVLRVLKWKTQLGLAIG